MEVVVAIIAFAMSVRYIVKRYLGKKSHGAFWRWIK